MNSMEPQTESREMVREYQSIKGSGEVIRDVGAAHGIGVGGAGPDEAGRLDAVRRGERDNQHNADRWMDQSRSKNSSYLMAESEV